MKKFLPNIIIIISILFLIYYLWSKSLLNFSLLNWNIHLRLSLLFLFIGFVISGMSWWWSLKVHKINISIKEGIKSHGLPIFAKYIPGKVWTILGRASQIAKHKDLSTTTLSFISLKEQLVYLVVGILISIVPIYLTYGFGEFFFTVLISGIGISSIVFSKKIHKLVLLLGKKIFKKELDFPLISILSGLKLSIFNIVLWISWTFGFYFFMLSFHIPPSINLAFIFPVSIVYGVLAIIMPGGIGIREGIITSFFVASGVQLEIATTIAVLSRLWFLIGEIFIFTIALAIKTITINK